MHLESAPWTIEADLLTPTFKLKRPQLQKKYQAQVSIARLVTVYLCLLLYMHCCTCCAWHTDDISKLSHCILCGHVRLVGRAGLARVQRLLRASETVNRRQILFSARRLARPLSVFAVPVHLAALTPCSLL